MTKQFASSADNSCYLDWPEEKVGQNNKCFKWHQPASNICLDFHGDPLRAQLVVFSDGNHHMALRECLDLFLKQKSDLAEIFYATTPPGPIVKMLKEGGLQMGNLIISITPHVFISPPDILDKLVSDGFMSGHVPLVRNQGNVLLVKKGNPKHISTVSDLIKPNVRLFLSNPETEKASFEAYQQTLKTMTSIPNLPDLLEEKMRQGTVLFGERIHHREAPQAVADGSADVAVVFYHLALRYLRIFPESFEMIALGGSVEEPAPLPGNSIGRTHMGVVGDGGTWGRALISFLASPEALQIYQSHGLRSVKDLA